MKKIVILILLLTLSACTSTGGIIGNLVPAPKLLKGEIKQDTFYISQNNEFQVMLPHPPSLSHQDDYEWTYTKVQEINEKNEIIGVIFGPAAVDLNRYHAVLIKLPIDSNLEEYVSKLFERKALSRSSKLNNIAEEQFRHNNMDAFYKVYESPQTYLVLSLVSNGKVFYLIESDVDKNSAIGLPNKEELISRNWDIFNRMFESFEIQD
jgi:hypothetical protein